MNFKLIGKSITKTIRLYILGIILLLVVNTYADVEEKDYGIINYSLSQNNPQLKIA